MMLNRDKCPSQIMWFALLVVFLLPSVLGQIPMIGRCPDFPVVRNFTAQKYLGKWYEIEKYFAIFELGGTCISATYSDLGNGTVGVFNAQTQVFTRRRRTINGVARITDPDGGAKLAVKFPTIPFAREAPYWILDTDYENYSVVWSCKNLAIINFQFLWFLARERSPSNDVRRRVHHTMESLGLSTSMLKRTDQAKCSD